MFTSKDEALQALYNDLKSLNEINFDALLDDGNDDCDEKQNASYAAASENLEDIRYRVSRYAFAAIQDSKLDEIWKTSWESKCSYLPEEQYAHINNYIQSLIKYLKNND